MGRPHPNQKHVRMPQYVGVKLTCNEFEVLYHIFTLEGYSRRLVIWYNRYVLQGTLQLVRRVICEQT